MKEWLVKKLLSRELVERLVLSALNGLLARIERKERISHYAGAASDTLNAIKLLSAAVADGEITSKEIGDIKAAALNAVDNWHAVITVKAG